MSQTVVIVTNTNPLMGEPLIKSNQTNFMKTKAYKDIEATLNDNRNMVFP